MLTALTIKWNFEHLHSQQGSVYAYTPVNNTGVRSYVCMHVVCTYICTTLLVWCAPGHGEAVSGKSHGARVGRGVLRTSPCCERETGGGTTHHHTTPCCTCSTHTHSLGSGVSSTRNKADNIQYTHLPLTPQIHPVPGAASYVFSIFLHKFAQQTVTTRYLAVNA